MPSSEDIARFIRDLSEQALASRQRRGLVLSGDADWCRSMAVSLLNTLACPDALWVGDTAPAGTDACPASKAQRVLGSELELVVFDAFSGMDPEALGAVMGALRGGGLFLLLTPALGQWGDYADPEHERIGVYPYAPEQISGRYLQRLARIIKASPHIDCWEQGRPLPALAKASPTRGSVPSDGDVYRTRDQQAAVEAIERVVHGHRRRPLVLSSDRGRGKSASLGLAAARLVKQGVRTILVTAPRLEAVATLFEHAGRHWSDAQRSPQGLHDEGAELRFIAPDELTRTLPRADLVIVDEAAAIPTPLLMTLLTHYARIVFSTTVHGYEGNGRGFALRFRSLLDTHTPGWHEQALVSPIRWAQDDPLEAFIFEALLLRASPAEDDRIATANVSACVISELDRDALLDDEALLSELFGLLVLAHYQTSPMDLRHLLDGPNVRVWCMRYQGEVVATALLAEEGGFDEAMAQQVWEGRRRPRGHLLAQSLSSHLGFIQAPKYRYARIMRIAVHPAVQGRGLGSALVAQVEAQARLQGMDFIGASFGATPELLDFWQANRQTPVRVGFSRGASSGTHAVMVLKPLTDEAQTLYAAMRQRFLQQLPMQLQSSLTVLAPAIAARCLRERVAQTDTELNRHDWRDIEGFAHALRGFEVSEIALWKLLLQALSADESGGALGDDERDLLIKKVLQKRPWGELGPGGDTGKRQLIQQLRTLYRTLLSHYRPL